jgi:hypothetical protein
MSSIALELDINEPVEAQDQLLTLKIWEARKAKLAAVAHHAHIRAKKKLMAAEAAVLLHPCPDEDL